MSKPLSNIQLSPLSKLSMLRLRITINQSDALPPKPFDTKHGVPVGLLENKNLAVLVFLYFEYV